jgi:hypothetical protein
MRKNLVRLYAAQHTAPLILQFNARHAPAAQVMDIGDFLVSFGVEPKFALACFRG